MKKLYLPKTFLKWDGAGCIISTKLRLLELESFLQLFYLLSFIRLRGGLQPP